jgi:hypothetical protein
VSNPYYIELQRIAQQRTIESMAERRMVLIEKLHQTINSVLSKGACLSIYIN